MIQRMKSNYAIGIDVGGTHLCSAVVDLLGRELCSVPVTTPMDSKSPVTEILSCFAGNIAATVRAFGQPVDKIAMAFPGPFEYSRGISLIRGVDKFESLYGLNVAESVRALLPEGMAEAEFRFLNDAASFALAESFCGAGRLFPSIMAITLGTGFGSGFVREGHLDTDPDRVPPRGEVWCLPFEGTIADNGFSTRWIIGRYRELTGRSVPGAREVAEASASESAAKQVFMEYGSRLGTFLHPILEHSGVQALVIGGSIARSSALFLEPLKTGLGDIPVRISSLFDQAAMIGAASLFNE